MQFQNHIGLTLSVCNSLLRRIQHGYGVRSFARGSLQILLKSRYAWSFEIHSFIALLRCIWDKCTIHCPMESLMNPIDWASNSFKFADATFLPDRCEQPLPQFLSKFLVNFHSRSSSKGFWVYENCCSLDDTSLEMWYRCSSIPPDSKMAEDQCIRTLEAGIHG